MKKPYSFATKDRKSLSLLHFSSPTEGEPAIVLDILETSLTANNKFYLDFGNKAPFHFFKCYPVDKEVNKLVDETSSTENEGGEYVHPTVWGTCRVVQSTVEGAPIGTVYMAMLPIATQVSFKNASINEAGDLVVDRPATHAAYNVFMKPSNTQSPPDVQSLALVCGPGYITGFGLYFFLEQADWYNCDTVVCTAASSKVSLALAFYMRQKKKEVQLIGYTSESNRAFCESTGLYDTILGYDEMLPEAVSKAVMVDVSGQVKPFAANKSKIIKLLVIGNASAAKEKASTFAALTPVASMKLVLTLMGAPSWIRKLLNPTQELFLIADTKQALEAEWGREQYQTVQAEHRDSFCAAASQWIKVRRCETEETIQQAFHEIVDGTVLPSEAIVLNMAKATAHRAS